MAKVSVLIPARNERFLKQTVESLFKSAGGEIEVIVGLDGPEQIHPIPDGRENLRMLWFPKTMGMRAMTNACAAEADGQYLMKTDAHCLFAPGFDLALQADCDDNWLVVPRRKRLDAERWEVEDPHRLPIDHHYLDCPMTNPGGFQFHGVVWPRRTSARLQIEIDETMSFQGSCWFMARRHWDWLGGMSEDGYGIFCQEPQELGNKTWLGGGQIMVNKKTWYAHLHKGKLWGRGYPQGRSELAKGHEWSARYWIGNQWAERGRDFEWLVEHFWPVPEWPDNWRTLMEIEQARQRHG